MDFFCNILEIIWRFFKIPQDSLRFFEILWTFVQFFGNSLEILWNPLEFSGDIMKTLGDSWTFLNEFLAILSAIPRKHRPIPLRFLKILPNSHSSPPSFKHPSIIKSIIKSKRNSEGCAMNWWMNSNNRPSVKRIGEQRTWWPMNPDPLLLEIKANPIESNRKWNKTKNPRPSNQIW